MGSTPFIGPIPASSIARAAEEYPGEEAAFKRCIRAMDRAFLSIKKSGGGGHRNTGKTLTPDALPAFIKK